MRTHRRYGTPRHHVASERASRHVTPHTHVAPHVTPRHCSAATQRLREVRANFSVTWQLPDCYAGDAPRGARAHFSVEADAFEEQYVRIRVLLKQQAVVEHLEHEGELLDLDSVRLR